MLVLNVLLYHKMVVIKENKLEKLFRQPLALAASRIEMLMNRHIGKSFRLTISNISAQHVTKYRGIDFG